MPDRPRPPSETPAELAALKRKFIEEGLARGKVQIRLDARRPGVRVPEHLLGDCALALNVSEQFPDTNMVVNDRGIAATLRFSKVPFRCLLPWSSVWGAVAPGTDTLHVWPPDLPLELGGPERSADAAEPAPVEPTRPRLAVVSTVSLPSDVEPISSRLEDVSSGDQPQAAAAPSEGEKPRAPWLRLVR